MADSQLKSMAKAWQPFDAVLHLSDEPHAMHLAMTLHVYFLTKACESV